MDDNSSLTPQEVADMLKIAKNTVYELIKRGELEAYRVGKKVRIDSNDVEKYKNRTRNTVSSSPIKDSQPSNFLFREDLTQNSSFVICGQDIMLDILARYLQLHPNGVLATRSYIGSYNGLYSLYHNNVQMSAVHLWDSDTNQYNLPFVMRMLPGIPAVIIRIASRLQGLYVAKNNPKKIKGWEDLQRKDITIINREKGSGTRVLLDEHLRRLKIPSQNIKGYERESTSHLAVASTVARGGADIGIGNEKSALQVKDVDFLPLQTEKYELVIKKADIEKPPFQAAIDILNSLEFKLELEGIGGYDLSEIGRIVAET